MLYEQHGPDVRNGHNTGYFPGGIYRYSKKFFVPAEWRDLQIMVEFEGVYMNSEVYINGQKAGGWQFGYTTFLVSVDDFLQYAQGNEIEVVAHNEMEPNSRWYTGSGIYRGGNLLEASHTLGLIGRRRPRRLPGAKLLSPSRRVKRRLFDYLAPAKSEEV